MEIRPLLLRAIEHFGVKHQTTKAVEELAELTAELTRIQDGRTDNDKICEECADVMIMCEQVALMYGYDEVVKWKEYKLNRLKERLEKMKKYNCRRCPFKEKLHPIRNYRGDYIPMIYCHITGRCYRKREVCQAPLRRWFKTITTKIRRIYEK